MSDQQESSHGSAGHLDEVLDADSLPQLPPNQPKGILGERGLDVYKTDEFEPDLNAGISQENDLPVVWLAIIVAYLVFFPVAFWLVWRTPLLSRNTKIILTALGAIGVAVVAWILFVK